MAAILSLFRKRRAKRAGANVTWVWGDNTVPNGVTSVTKNLGSASLSNAVVVDPASALLGFGASRRQTHEQSPSLRR
jgi:hypothetical protein